MANRQTLLVKSYLLIIDLRSKVNIKGLSNWKINIFCLIPNAYL